MTELQSFISAPTARQPERFVVAEAWDLDAAQSSGKWISSDTIMQIKP